LIYGYLDSVDQGGSGGGLGLILFMVLLVEWTEEVHLLHESMIFTGE
jgi:hypothetical protein